MIEPKKLLNLTRDRIPRREAELILSGILKRDRYQLYLNPEPLPYYKGDRFLHSIELWEKGYPIQYILHQAYFLDLSLFINPGVFIPRPETEEFIEKIASLGLKPKLIVDIGTGCGNIAIALARLYKEARIIATDISQDALRVAGINIRRYHLDSRIEPLLVDLLPSDIEADLIISNPPYIRTSEIHTLPLSVKYEPRIALDGGEDGLSVIKRIILKAPKLLKRRGVLALEISPDLKFNIEKTVPPEFKNILFEKDLRGVYRFCLLFKR